MTFNFLTRSLIKLFSFIILICIITSCLRCENCENKLNIFIKTNAFPYKDGNEVVFQNDKNEYEKYIVEIIYNSPDGTYGCIGSDDNSNGQKCDGNLIMKIGDFSISFNQGPNFFRNEVKYVEGYCNYCITNDYYHIIDTSNVLINNTNIKGKHYFNNDTSLNKMNGHVIEYWVSFDRKLLCYTKYKNDTLNRWILK